MFMQVLSPSTTLWDQQTLFVIHGPGEIPHGRIAQWSPLTDEGWTLVFPQWEAPAQLRTHLEECRTKRGLDPARIVIAGVSEGAPPALELAGEAGLPWLCVSPALPAGYDLTPLTAVPQRTRGAVIDAAGSRLAAMLRDAGVSVKAVALAEPFAVIASEALKAIYG